MYTGTARRRQRARAAGSLVCAFEEVMERGRYERMNRWSGDGQGQDESSAVSWEGARARGIGAGG